ncbi:MAG: hypothetical protein ACYC2K_02320 [Gemmatimonadales bacterium]
MSVPTTVHAIVPLSLLEAIRNLDTPPNDGLPAELSEEAFAKRLGLSPTVAAQIERYREALEQGTMISEAEGVQVFRLAGRRSDAELVYADAGRRAARHAVRLRVARPAVLTAILPSASRRRAGQRRAARALDQVFGVRLDSEGGTVWMRVERSLAMRAGFAGSGCEFYRSLALELLRLTSGFEGTLFHPECEQRGAIECRWTVADADGSGGKD